MRLVPLLFLPALMSAEITYLGRATSGYVVKPALTPLSAAGEKYTDTTFVPSGVRVLRVTDRLTLGGDMLDKSFTGWSDPSQTSWNVDNTLISFKGVGGATIVMRFDPVAFTVSSIQPRDPYGHFVTNAIFGEPSWSGVNPNLLYGTAGSFLIKSQNVLTKALTTVLDVTRIIPSPVNTGTLSMSKDDDVIAMYAGGPQDGAPKVIWYKRSTDSWHVLDTQASTLDGVALGTTLGFLVHSAFVEFSGRYVNITPSGGGAQWVWDAVGGTVASMPSYLGHSTYAYGMYANTAGEGLQLYLRSLANMGTFWPLVPADILSSFWDCAQHPSWNDAGADNSGPILMSGYLPSGVADNHQEIGEEILMFASDGSLRFWRALFHRSIVNGAYYTFYYTPRANISNNGKWALFTSNWDLSLGNDTTGHPRYDVFLTELGINEPPPVPKGTSISSGAALSSGASIH